MAERAAERVWGQAYGSALTDATQTQIALEEDATTITNFEPVVVPGLLRTAAYARAVISTAVLERARRKRVWPAPWEEDADYYLRAAELEGPVPDLRACLDEPRCPVASWIPEDEFFTARATDMLFRRRQRRFRRGGPDPC